ncbi:MAG: MlaD family protein [Solirubrobacteraceae bacterium]
MQTGTPSFVKVITMVLFALSCVGLLLFLWLSFGGTLPLNAQGYRIRVSFQNADQLATQADVRVAGVSIGRVIGKSLDPQGNRTIATIQIDTKFAPIRQDARAILREKTILGETYVAMTRGTPNSPAVADGGLLSRGHVTHAVQLDEVYNTFDAGTRRAFRGWQQQLARTVRGNDQNLNSVLGNLPPFAADATDVLRVLDIQHVAVERLLQNGGTVFGALNASPAALHNLITTAQTTFATTAANHTALTRVLHAFPAFLDQTKTTMARLQSFSLNTDPLLGELQPVARDLGPTLHSVRVLSPDLRSLFFHLGPLITASRTGLPALRDVLHGAQPLLGSVGPFLEQLNPVLTWLSLHQQLVSDFISVGAAGLAAKTTSFAGGGLSCGSTSCGHALRQYNILGLETLSLPVAGATRNANNRGNTYPPPLWLADPRNFSAGGNFPGSFALPSWDCRNTGAGGDGSVAANSLPAPLGREACWVAPPLGPLVGQPGKFPQILSAKYPSR